MPTCWPRPWKQRSRKASPSDRRPFLPESSARPDARSLPLWTWPTHPSWLKSDNSPSPWPTMTNSSQGGERMKQPSTAQLDSTTQGPASQRTASGISTAGREGGPRLDGAMTPISPASSNLKATAACAIVANDASRRPTSPCSRNWPTLTSTPSPNSIAIKSWSWPKETTCNRPNRSSWSATLDWANLNQFTTPIGATFAPEQTVTVVDPRHPLCGRTLPLVGITQKPYLGRCCVVWIHPHVERHVPVSATDLEFDPNQLSPLPLSIASVRQLLHVFHQVWRASQGAEADGIPTECARTVTDADHCTPGMGPSDFGAAASSAPGSGPRLRRTTEATPGSADTGGAA